MQAISIIGFSNSGKTTLISRLSECLEARGLKVAIAKHTHHELDKPDTDTALLMGPKRTIVGLSNTKDGKGEAMIHWGHPCFLRDLVPLLDADILLVEGGKTIGWLPRILCLRTTPELLTALPEGCKALRPELALATYGDNKLPGLPSFTAEDLDALVDLILGSIYGGISGYFGGTLDIIMMRLLEIINGIPYLIIVILLMMILRPGMMTIIIAYSLVGWIPMARLVRGQVVALKQQEYIAAAAPPAAHPALRGDRPRDALHPERHLFGGLPQLHRPGYSAADVLVGLAGAARH